MTTTEAAEHMARQNMTNYGSEQSDTHPAGSHYDRYEMEKKVFNTGPSVKTMPTPFQQHVPGNNVNTHPQQLNRAMPVSSQVETGHAEAAPNNLPLQPPSTASNESSSNMSCGGYCSEEKDIDPMVQQYNKVAAVPSLPEKKGPKKRKLTKTPYGTDAPRIEDTPRPKQERKITEYTVKKSPSRPQYMNGGDNSLSNDMAAATHGMCISPVPQITRIPTVGVVYSSSDGSNSNQSPPSSSSANRVEVEVQTDVIPEIDGGGAIRQLQEDLKKDQFKQELMRMNNELKQSLEIQRAKVRASKETIKQLLIKQSRMERKQAKERCMEASLRIGQFKPTRRGEHFKDEWTDGWAMEEINKRLMKINQERNEILNASQNLRKRKPMGKELKRQAADIPSTSNASYTDDGFLRPELPKEMTAQEFMEQDEIYRLRKEHLKKEEADLQAEKDRLERERNIHIREMKRVQYEEQSRFKDHELLNNRYLLLSLLGKGGFSEVWRAFDLDENRYVACKIHHVNKEWKEDKKANYVKHAMREKDIHKSLDHPRIVRLFDLFTIDNDSFCTVLEYCDGNDLDFYLKQHKQIPEKEARCIVMQVVSALKYLGERKHPIIHYDLKPANILLQSGTTGEIKLTDFGLSKMVENEDDGDSIDLTSQGAGTYWYLPPETFEHSVHGAPVKISSKVDVWSVGVIFYQCLYGRRPFGHERTQQQILEEKTILNALEGPTFPSKPPVSAIAQDFIRRCLQYRKEERADVSELFKHELFKPRGQKSQQPPSPSSMKNQRMDSSDADL
ncbi:protein kinase domain-containing protein [Ditylenchus destructor]|nr:protein kinase domain-containing protein [Ditylenchus destructor]